MGSLTTCSIARGMDYAIDIPRLAARTSLVKVIDTLRSQRHWHCIDGQHCAADWQTRPHLLLCRSRWTVKASSVATPFHVIDVSTIFYSQQSHQTAGRQLQAPGILSLTRGPAAQARVRARSGALPELLRWRAQDHRGDQGRRGRLRPSACGTDGSGPKARDNP